MRDERRNEAESVPLSFEDARARLRARGYLDGGVEGAVLKGTLAARNRVTALVFASLVAALLLAGALALGETAILAAASSLSARDAAVLALWLLAGATLAALPLVLLLVVLAWARTRARHAEGASTELGLAFGLLAGAAGALAALPALEGASPLTAAGVLAFLALAVFLAIRVARALAFSVLVASGRALLLRGASVARARAVALGIAALTVMAAVAMTRARRPPPADEPLVTEANARRVTLVGIDGWSPRYAPLALSAGVRYAYVKETRDPAAFWTTVATGEPPKKHGIGSLDLVRVAGMREPLKPGSGSRWFLGTFLPRLHLARRESVTSAARRVPAIWDVARRAGIPSLVVDWWTTYPADAGAGTILGNHLFFAARAGLTLAGEGWPSEAAERAARLAERSAPEPGTLERLVADAQGLDDFSLKAWADARERERPRLSLLYLPGLDILGSALEEPSRTAEDRVALAKSLTEEAEKLAHLLDSGALTGDSDLWALLLDGGRRAPGGTLLVGGPLAGAGAGSVRAVDVAPTLLAALGVPASREVAGRVRADLLVPGAATAAAVRSWGARREVPPPVDPKAYVDNLKSLGYLK